MNIDSVAMPPKNVYSGPLGKAAIYTIEENEHNYLVGLSMSDDRYSECGGNGLYYEIIQY